MLMHTTYSRVTMGTDGRPEYHRAGVGRSMLGWWVWYLLGDMQRPMNSWASEAWAKAVRANPKEAIRAYNAGREDVDVDQVMKVLGQVKEMRPDGEN